MKWYYVGLLITGLLISACSGPNTSPTTPTSEPQTVPPQPIVAPTVVTNPAQEYAMQLGLPDTVVDRLELLGKSEMSQVDKSFVDYLNHLSRVEIFPTETLVLLPSDYQDKVNQLLQVRVLDAILRDNEVSSKETSSLAYLSTFPGKVQRELIEFGLDDTMIDFLISNSSLENQDFAKYAVENKLCINDHKLTSLEKSFLEKPEEHAQVLLNNYLSELSYTYPELAEELRRLPELKTDTSGIEAVEDILGLASSNDAEVKEAFELMIKGGTPDPSDFQYEVPDWNTELQVLYKLAEQNEFKRNDTLAQAIAMSNGFWVTIGDDDVKEAVYKNTNDLLNFFRETSEIQKARGYYQLEDYPLEAKVSLGWTGGYSSLYGRNIHASPKYIEKGLRLTLKGYNWNTSSIDTLRKMRNLMDKRGWIEKDVYQTTTNLEELFYFDGDNIAGKSKHWIYTDGEDKIIIDGEDIVNHAYHNVDFTLNYYLENGKAIGDCGDEALLISTFLKSWGYASNIQYRQTWKDRLYSHFYSNFFDPLSGWKAYEKQLNVQINMSDTFYFYVIKPPVYQPTYLTSRWVDEPFKHYEGNMVYFHPHTLEEIKSLFITGVPASQMKEWLLYNTSPSSKLPTIR